MKFYFIFGILLITTICLKGEIILPKINCNEQEFLEQIDLDSTYKEDYDNQLFCYLNQYLDAEMDSILYQRLRKFTRKLHFNRIGKNDYQSSKMFANYYAIFAEKANDLKSYSHALYRIALCNYRMGSNYEAFDKITEGVSLSRRLKDSSLLSTQLMRQGWIYWQLYRFEDAIESAEEFRKIRIAR
ncbi:MAG: hypothetical protein AAGK97_06255, partial [Bacteroidota bacterium]